MSFENRGGLIEVDQLARSIEEKKDLLIFDFRSRLEYAFGRIPGAHRIDRSEYLIWPMSAERIEEERAKLEELFSSHGAQRSTLVALYDSSGSHDAAKFWFLTSLFRRDRLDMRIVNGGVDQWRSQGFELEREFKAPHRRARSKFILAAEPDLSALASHQEIRADLADHASRTILLDVRSEDEFSARRRVRAASAPGRIPGAEWIEYKEALDESMRFKSLDHLRDKYARILREPDRKVIVYCQSGYRSAHTFFVLSSLLGRKNVKSYDGSWGEWSIVGADLIERDF